MVIEKTKGTIIFSNGRFRFFENVTVKEILDHLEKGGYITFKSKIYNQFNIKEFFKCIPMKK